MNNEGAPFVQVTQNPVKDFFKRLYLTDIRPFTLIIVTPIIGSLSGTRYSLERLRQKIEADKIQTYIITRRPQEQFHLEAIEILMKSDLVEIRYNNSLHAKLYVCMGKETGFAFLGSGNLTRTSMEQNTEIGLIIFPYGRGRQILHELYYWGSVRLRTLSESKIAKKITYRRRI